MAIGDSFKKLAGTLRSYFQVGGTSGPRWKNNAGVWEAKNSDDSAFAEIRALAPTGDRGVVTRKYLESYENTLIVKRQADCSAALPPNTGVRGIVVVTTAGTGAVIGDVLYDDGSSVGNMEILAAIEGRTILVTDALAGGTVAFLADTRYTWDADGGSWLAEINITSGAIRSVRYVLDNTATQDSTITVPANARIYDCIVEITTPYSAGATISVGRVGSVSLCQATTDNDALTAGEYSVEQDTAWGATTLVVRTTIAGAPAAGAGVVIVNYCIPNA